MNPLEIAASTSPWAQVNVGEKALLILGLLVLTIALPPLPALPIIGVIILVAAARAQVPWKLYGALVAAPATFIILGIFPLVATITTHGIERVDGGLTDAATVLGRSIVGMSATMLFALTTPMSEQLLWFRRIHVPESIVHVTMLTYRMSSQLVETSRTMWQAQAQRLGHTNKRRWLRSSAHQIAALFVIAFARARAMQEGLELRADAACYRTLTVARPVRTRNIVCSIIILALVMVIGLKGAQLWG